MRQAFPPDNFFASDDVSMLLIFSWLRGFSFLRLNRRRRSPKKLFDGTKKGPEEIPGLRHFG
jgi:hypothetical protein